MTSWYYDVSLEEIFDALDEAYQNGGPPARTKTESQGSLFEISKTPEHASPGSKESACGGPVDTALLLRELSLNAYDALVLAWMSEYPIEANILSYGWQVIQAAKKAAETTRGATQAASAGVTRGAAPQVANAGAAQDASAASTKTPADQGPVEAWARLPEARAAAERAAVNRLEANTAAVLEAAARTRREVHRLEGLLRFSTGPDHVLVALCEPDHFTLPLLAGHFERRFAAQAWAVFDKRRKLWLLKLDAAPPRLAGQAEADFSFPAGTALAAAQNPQAPDPWEGLWRSYFKAVNNEDRKNPKLQKSFMPGRYWKYLPEMNQGEFS